MRLFDCNAYAGVSLKPPLEPVLTPDELIVEMDNCGVDFALVNHDGGEYSNPLESNIEISEFCASDKRLTPVWNILPPQTEMNVNDLVSNMRINGVSALRALPAAHRYLLNEITMGTLFAELVRLRIPLFLNVDEGWQVLYEVMASFPDMILIATDHGCWGQDRYFRPLLDRYSHFYIDTSRYELDGGLEQLVEQYGSTRLLFGSAYHRVPMGGASLLLRHAEIDDSDREAIGSGNLERILNEVEI